MGLHPGITPLLLQYNMMISDKYFIRMNVPNLISKLLGEQSIQQYV